VPSYAAILDAIGSTLREIEHLSHENGVQVGHAITETFVDLPMAQVYPEGSSTDESGGNNDRNTFRGIGRVTVFRVVIDVACRTRSHIGEDIESVISMADEIQDKLEEQRTKPIFGLDGIQGIDWRWERVTHQRGAGTDTTLFPGLRLNLTVRIF
jgi:hypothetical protein